MIPEARLERTDAGLIPTGEGWYVANAREVRWVHREGRGSLVPLTGWVDGEVDAPELGVNLFVLGPGEPMSMYHGEEAQEDFLVLAGEAVLVIEGEERALRQWDFVHCPAWTEHTIVGAGTSPCVVLAIGGRAGEGIRYPLDAVAASHGASSEVETESPAVAYARFAKGEPRPYPDGSLP